MWVQKPGPLQEQQVILAAEPSLQPSNWYFEEKHGNNQQSQRVREGSFQTGTNRLAVYKTCLFTWVAGEHNMPDGTYTGRSPQQSSHHPVDRDVRTRLPVRDPSVWWGRCSVLGSQVCCEEREHGLCAFCETGQTLKEMGQR